IKSKQANVKKQSRSSAAIASAVDKRIPETAASTVAALRQSLAELERRNLIDMSPTRRGLRSARTKSDEKVKSRKSHSSRRREQSPSRKEAKVHSGSGGRYIVTRS
uniref:H15 domain-containing protein n=1 Tax=Macrostomum lignano TaxID=282301 RepID=A0A1I8ISB6_9PLAT